MVVAVFRNRIARQGRADVTIYVPHTMDKMVALIRISAIAAEQGSLLLFVE